jgi:hypothetical protein
MKRLLLICVLYTNTIYAQDYITYHHVFHRIDEDVLAENWNMALQRLDTIYVSYDFIYAKHCLKAIQICGKVGDKKRGEQWLHKSFLQGVPLWILFKSEPVRSILQNYSAAGIQKAYDSLRSLHKSRINLQLAAQVDKMEAEDIRRTRRVNDGFFLFRHTIYGLQWIQMNKRHARTIKTITETYGYPGERLIGLSGDYDDSVTLPRFHFWHRLLSDERAYVMLIHHYSYPGINIDLQEAVKNGYMHPEQFGTISDYKTRYGKGRDKKAKYYYVWYDKMEESPDAVEQRRHAIGLNTLQQQKRNANLEMERAKNKVSQKEVILE